MMSGGPPVRGYEPHRPSIIPSSPAPPALTGTLKLACPERWYGYCAGCWIYRAVFTFGYLRCRGVAGEVSVR